MSDVAEIDLTANARAALDLQEWLSSVDSLPGVVAAFNALFIQFRAQTIAAIAHAAGTTHTYVEAAGGATIADYLASVSEGLQPTPKGMVACIDTPWADPPVPEPGAPFDVCWTEQNVGQGDSGPYKALVEIAGITVEIECTELAAGGSVQRRATFAGAPEGALTITVYTPWNGSLDRPLVQPQAGYVNGVSGTVTVGQGGTDAAAADAAASQETEQTGIYNAVGYFGALLGEYDPSSASWAIQGVAAAAPSMADELLALAGQVLSRDPSTISQEARQQITELARTAYSQGTAVQSLAIGTRLADHPQVLQLAAAARDVAEAIINAPMPEDEAEAAEAEAQEGQ